MGRINDYTERTTLTGSEELVGVEGSSTFKLTPETLRAYDESQVLTGTVTKTLATSGGDFTTLTAFFDWMEATTFSDADITLNVSAGTYVLTGTQRSISASDGIRRLYILGADRATCIFNVNVTGSGGTGVLKLTNAANARIEKVTINRTAGLDLLIQANQSTITFQTAAITDYLYPVYAAQSCNVGVYATNITAPAGGTNWALLDIYQSDLSVSGCTLDGVVNTQGLGIFSDSCTTFVYLTTFTNLSMGVQQTFSRVRLHTVTFTGNTTDTNIPLNEIQGDGSYITDGNLSVKNFVSSVDDETYGNYAIGLNALDSLTSGSGLDNIAIGENAGTAITTGDNNIAIGTDALKLQTVSGSNVAIGTRSQDANSSCVENTSVGYQSLSSINTGDNWNTAIGAYALETSTNSDSATAIGHNALKNSTGGTNSTAVGANAGLWADGNNNTIVGTSAMSGINNTGSYNTVIGVKAGINAASSDYALILGANVDFPDASSNIDYQIAVGGSSTGTSVNFIEGFLSTGVDLDWSAKTVTITGPSALAAASTNLNAGDLILQGGKAATTGIGIGGDLILKGGAGGSTGTQGQITLNATNWVTDTTYGNYGIGLNALDSLTSGSGLENIAIGEDAGTAMTTTSYNIAIGTRTLPNAGAVAATVAIGYEVALASLNNVNNIRNVAIGYRAMKAANVAKYTTVVGAESGGTSVGMGDYSTIVGALSGTAAWNDYNSVFGSMSYNNASAAGTNNSIFGYNAAGNLTSGNFAVVIGSNVDPDSATDNDQIVIGNGGVSILSGYMSARSDLDYSAKSLTLSGTSAFPTSSTNLNAGDLILQGGTAATTGTGVGGDLILKGGAKGSTGVEGKVSIQTQAGATLFNVGPNNGDNIYIGESSGLYATGENYNVGIGVDSMGAWGVGPTSGGENTGIGTWALSALANGSGNVAVGAYAGGTITSGGDNTLIGNAAGQNVVAADYNTLIGSYAGQNITGSSNIAIGRFAGNNITSGSNNIVVGLSVNPPSTTGSSQLVIGDAIVGYMSPLTDVNYSAYDLTVSGPSAKSNATVNLNAGDLILQGGKAATTGIGIGGDLILKGGAGGSAGTGGKVYVAGTMLIDTIGTNNFFIGPSTPITLANAGNRHNIHIGPTYTTVRGGSFNISIGDGSLGGDGAGLTGSANQVIGDYAAAAVTSGNYNIILGDYACSALTTGSQNIVLGGEACGSLVDGKWNVVMGVSALSASVSGNYNVEMGFSGATSSTGDSNVLIGSFNANLLTSGNFNIVIGAEQEVLSPTDNDQIVIGTRNSNLDRGTIFGYMTPRSDTDTSGKSLTVSGPSAFPTATTNLNAGDLILQGGTAATTGIGIGGDLILKGGAGGTTGTQGQITLNATNWVTDTTNGNYAIGLNALDSLSSGSGLDNIAIGENAGTALTTGDFNIAIGTDALLGESTGSGTVAIGFNAGKSQATESNNVFIGTSVASTTGMGGSNIVAIGYEAYKLNPTNQDGNIAIGSRSMSSQTVGAYNTAIGTSALENATSGAYKIALGNGALKSANGDHNVGIGRSAGSNITTGTGNLVITSGSTGSVPVSTDDHQVLIGNGTASVYTPIIAGYMAATTDIDHSGKSLTITGTSAYSLASTNLNAGDLILQGGTAATTGIGIGGDLILKGGAGGTTGTQGQVKVEGDFLASAVYNNQTGTTYTIQASDNGKVLTFDNVGAIAVTLPDTLDVNFHCSIVQVGAGVPTVTPTTDTINGAGTGVAPAAQWKAMYLSQYSDTNWLALIS